MSNNSARKVWLARHGERRDHVDEHWKHRTDDPFDPPLTERGLKQARELAGKRTGHHIFTFLRCIQTACQVASRIGLDIKVEPGTTEWLNEEWFGLNSPEWKSAEELSTECSLIDLTYRPISEPKHPETRCFLKERAKKTIFTLTRERYPFENILIVTHGASVEALALGLFPERPVDWVTYCSLTELVESNPNQWTLTRMCDTSFLSEPELSFAAYQ
eukprot:jgi/Galph1/5905/GphlegSOOS_G4611.1